MKKLILLVALVLAVASTASAISITFSGPGNTLAPTYNAGNPPESKSVYDNNTQTRVSWSSTGNGGPNTTMILNSAQNNRRELLRFDISQLNGLLTSVSSATLKLTLSAPATNKLLTINRAGAANSNWEEGWYGWSGFFSSSSSYQLQTSSSYVRLKLGQVYAAWGDNIYTGLVSGNAGDVISIPLNSVQTSAYIQSMLQTWATNGVTDRGRGSFEDPIANVDVGFLNCPNDGFVMLGNDITFASSNNTTYTGPQLILNYGGGGGAVPEPSALAFVGLGMLGLVRRRRS